MPRCSTELFDVTDQVGRGVRREVDLRLRGVRGAAAAVALVELDDAVAGRVVPAPGSRSAARSRPPWRITTGLPSGLPATSQAMRCPSPTSSIPSAYGSIGGYLATPPPWHRGARLRRCPRRRPTRTASTSSPARAARTSSAVTAAGCSPTTAGASSTPPAAPSSPTSATAAPSSPTPSGSALAGGAYVMPIWPTPHRVRLHDLLVDRWLPAGMGHVFFTSGGSESADSAVRLARAYHVANGRPERWKVIGRHPSYHGITLGALAAGSHSGRRAGYDPLLLDFPKVPWDDAGARGRGDRARGPETIAGFLFEPITGAAGRLPDAVRRLLAGRRGRLPPPRDPAHRRRGDDRVRAHRPALGSRPLPDPARTSSSAARASAAATSRSAWSPRPTRSSTTSPGAGFMFFTFTGSDAMCAGAAAVLEIIEAERPRRPQCGDGRGARGPPVADALGGHPDVVELRGRGLFRGIELTPSGGRLAAAVVGECLARDMWIYPAGSAPVPRRRDDRLPVHHHGGRDRAARRDASPRRSAAAAAADDARDGIAAGQTTRGGRAPG